MRKRAFLSTTEDPWTVDPFAHVTARQNGKIAIAKDIPVPVKAILSEGILSWEWTTPILEKKRGKTTVRSSTAHLFRKVSPRLWKDFLQLAEADDEKFVAFAERWGHLKEPSAAAELSGCERLDRWRFFARLASALRNCSIAVAQEKPGAAQHWEQICKWLRRLYDPDLAKPIGEKRGAGLTLYRRALITQALNRWFDTSPGNTLIGWRHDYKMVIEPAVTSLFGIIGVQLAYGIVGAAEMLVCYHCTRFFTPPRKPPTGKRVFCPECRKTGKPQLHAMRDFRSRISPPR
jgi:hypothetical protein